MNSTDIAHQEALEPLFILHNGANMSAPQDDQTSIAESETSLASLGSERTRVMNGKPPNVLIARPVFNQESFDEFQTPSTMPTKTLKDRLIEAKSNMECSGRCCKSFVLNQLPFLKIFKNYNVKEDLMGDTIAGLTVGIMHIPQGMAYGLLTTLPAVYGLYVSFLPTLFYFIMGTSRHVSIGTFAVVCLMVGSAVEKANCGGDSVSEGSNSTMLAQTNTMMDNDTMLSGNGTGGPSSMSHEVLMCKVGVAMAVTFVVGIIQFVLGLCRLGFVTIYLSEPLTRGLTTGAAIHVFTSQIKSMFGIKVTTYQGPLKLVYTYIEFFSRIVETNLAALIMSVICVVALALVKEFANPRVKKAIKMPVPMELVLVIVGTVTSYFWGMEERFGISVVGDIPTGIPAPAFPPINRFSSVILDAVSIALVSFAINLSMVKLFAKKNNYETDANQELVAYGICNMAGSIFNCFVSSVSLSRSLVQEGVGGKTQVVGLVSSALLLVVLFAIGPLFEQLPKCVLAAIIVVNLKGMFLQFNDLKMLWKISMYDFLSWVVVFVAVVLLDVDIGMGIGITFCLLSVVFRTQSPYTSVMGRVKSTELYKNVAIYPEADEIDGVKIFRFEASLYFANIEYFVQELFAKSGVDPRKILAAKAKATKNKKAMQKKYDNALRKRKNQSDLEPEMNDHEIVDVQRTRNPVTHIIIDCSTMGYVDYVGVNTLRQVIQEYKKVDVTVTLAGCKVMVRDMLQAAGFHDHIDKNQLFLSVHDAVMMAANNNGKMLTIADVSDSSTKL